MASAPQPQLPLFYKDLMPLNSRDHAKWKNKGTDSANWLIGQHAIPLTVDEFVQTQRDFPIIFSSGDNPLPLALMGLNEGVNTFVDDKGKINEPIYLPAYIRRYPFMLAKLTPEGDDLSLCFDPTAGTIGEFDEGDPLFDDEGKATPATQNILQFCEHFEGAGQRTKAFIDELKKHDLLMDGEIAISQNDNPDKPFVYRGFQMIDQEKLQDIKGNILRDWNKNGMMVLIHAHIMSLDLMRAIFARQVSQGTAPKADAEVPAT
ncbi:SapC family protein [Pontixanthobacter aquaemixtae]|uniref:Multidrug transporter n=1 Tax=Pontixanthobacter aquaemixtae TaxID=1958940 RepID=A0A844ZSU1_9SPHN|nr:SapC family protein [Pontixanthobacter aquaemixtae]MXO90554.1 multidrug transporter [Pontixanthobacter aquaemixtae]